MSTVAHTLAARLASFSPTRGDSRDSSAPIADQAHPPSTATCSQPASCSSSIDSSSTRAFDTRSVLSDSALPSAFETLMRHEQHKLRRNEHLAVLLRKDLWKPDSQASRCDTFLCSKRFSIFERKHHCRKCGGIFCSECSTRATALLDTTNLQFLNPPRNVSIYSFESEESPVAVARVCDECYDQINGTCISRTGKQRSASVQWESDSVSSTSSASTSPRLPPTPLDGSAIGALPIRKRPLPRRAHTSPRVQTLSNPTPPSPPISEELAAYPLRNASAICKATGGGRWEPKPVKQWVGARAPGCKAQYEIDMEREEEEIRRQKANPIIRDGDFQLRAPREFEPRSMGGPLNLSTF